jgi:Transcriptional regulator
MPRAKTLSDGEVMHAATAILRARGPEGLTFQSLSAACGLSAATLVQRFQTKAKMKQAVLLHAWDALGRKTTELAASVPRTPRRRHRPHDRPVGELRGHRDRMRMASWSCARTCAIPSCAPAARPGSGRWSKPSTPASPGRRACRTAWACLPPPIGKARFCGGASIRKARSRSTWNQASPASSRRWPDAEPCEAFTQAKRIGAGRVRCRSGPSCLPARNAHEILRAMQSGRPSRMSKGGDPFASRTAYASQLR